MNKKVSAFLAFCLCLILYCSTALADNQVSQIEIDVALREDGSACITQTWTADLDEGTEFYLVNRYNGYLSITDFTVSDELGTYTFLEEWDVDASMEEKARKCGIVETADGVELCWGIGSYGQHTYTLSYVLHDLVGSYTDADGFHYRFVDEMDFFPTGVTLTIRCEDGTALTDEICDIWAFGYDGQIRFEEGAIRAFSESPLESGEHVTIMMAVEQEVLAPMRAVDDSFEAVKEQAFVDSDYEYEHEEELTTAEVIIIMIMSVIPPLLVVWLILKGKKKSRKRLQKELNQVEYFRDVPNDGDLNISYILARCGQQCEEGSLLSAYLLRLICQGSLEPLTEADEKKGARLQLVRPPKQGTLYDDVLYTILAEAAGGGGILEPKELEHYCDFNRRPLAAFMDSCEKDAETAMVQRGFFANAIRNSVRGLTQYGRQQYNEVMGLKRYLLEFSLIHERGVNETVIWQEYMIYAQLLGIADKVAEQIQKLYPEAAPQIRQYQHYSTCATSYHTVLYNAIAKERAQQQMVRSGGSGGHASFGGGGGFSGGGGGGTR